MGALAFLHRFVPAQEPGRPPLLLLHGTGGTEEDLLPLGPSLLPGAALLSPRGNVVEHGMPRFFRRLAEGRFDPLDVRRGAAELAGFVAEASVAYGLEPPVAVGFSNGANVAAAVLQQHPGVLAGAVLWRPMDVLDAPPLAGAAAPVLMVSGAADPIVPAASADALAARLRAGGAILTREVLRAGHGLTEADMALARGWLGRLAGLA